jgi:ATP-binding cassette subfamily B protein
MAAPSAGGRSGAFRSLASRQEQPMPGRRVLMDAARDAWAWNAAYVLASLSCAGAALLLPAALAASADALLAGPRPAAMLWRVGGLLAADAAGTALASVAKNAAEARSARRLRMMMVRRIMAAGPGAGDHIAAGDLAGRAGSAAATAAAAPFLAINLGTALLTSAGALLALVLLDPWLGLVFVVVAPVTALLARRFAGTARPAYRRYFDQAGAAAGLLAEAMEGARTIRASRAHEQERARVLAVLPALSATGLSTWRIAARSTGRLAAVSAAGQVAVLGIATAAVFAGRLRPGELLAVSGYAMMAARLPGQSGQLAAAGAAAARVAEVLELPPLPSRPAPGPRDPAPAVLSRPPGAGLAVRDLTVRRGERPVLHQVSFDIPAGGTLAVVGASGAGKTTLAETAAGLRPAVSGTITLDGAPLAAGDAAVAFARPVLLGETIRACLAYGRPGAADGELRQAARAAGIDHLVDRLPRGYDTPLDGLALSGGELQRLGLARALLRGSRLLILDDAMSSLDALTLARVHEALESGRWRCTQLVISASPRILAAARAVLWLDAGTVRAIGTHGELSRDPAYRALIASVPGRGTTGPAARAIPTGQGER